MVYFLCECSGADEDDHVARLRKDTADCFLRRRTRDSPGRAAERMTLCGLPVRRVLRARRLGPGLPTGRAARPMCIDCFEMYRETRERG